MATTGGPFPATSMPDRNWWSALWPDPEGTLRQLGIAPDMSVLDLCCGDGYFTAPLAKLVGGKVYAHDLDPVMIERAKEEVLRQGTSVRKWINADALDAAHHLSATVDCVLMANAFHGVPDQTRLAAVIHKVLRPGGILVIVNWHPLPLGSRAGRRPSCACHRKPSAPSSSRQDSLPHRSWTSQPIIMGAF